MNPAVSPPRRRSPTRDFFGKYAGKVVSTADPETRGRLQVVVPEVQPGVPVWALPAAPFAGPGVGFFALPPGGANVWVEYQAGNLQHPIWTGCFWEPGDLPAADAVPGVTLIRTDAATVRIDDNTRQVRIEIGGARITLGPAEIKIEAPQIRNRAGAGQTALSSAGFDAQQGALRVI